MNKIIQAVTSIATPITEKHGCELWDVEYAKEAGSWFLRVYIDHPDGVSINLCESISHEIDAILDEHEDLIPGSYTFEVSSAGVERRLRGSSDYDRFAGKLVEVKLYKARDGQKTFLGKLVGSRDGGVELDISDQRHTFEKAEIAYVRLRMG